VTKGGRDTAEEMVKKRSKRKETESPNSKRNTTKQGKKLDNNAKTTPNKKKGKTAEEDEEAGNLMTVNGMTSFLEYNHALMKATEVCVGQKWNEDGSGEVSVLRDRAGKMIAAWTGREERVGREDNVMRVHKEHVQKVQSIINKIQKDRSKHRKYAGDAQMWLQGVTNPRWTEEECLKWTKENGWDTAVLENKGGKDTSWYCIKLYPQKGSLKMLWYITGRVGFQGVAGRMCRSAQ
jgi:hypothetical protein